MTAVPLEANAAVLEAAAVHGWFVARKTAAIWARRLDAARIVTSREGSELAEAGDYLCRAPDGGRWPQVGASVEERYARTDDIDADGFRRWIPDPEAARVWASPLTGAAVLATRWGELRGVPGDLLVKPWSVRVEAAPEDLWIVERAVFEATYERLDNLLDGAPTEGGDV